MKALLSHRPGGPETLSLEEAPDPVAGRGELLVDVLACAVNYPDVLIIEDKYQSRPPRPFAPGAEISGRVREVGMDVEGWTPGDVLIGMIGHGGMAERAVVPAGQAFALPQGRDPVEGAGLLLTYATTIHALVDRGELKADETLLVLGAAGGVGLAAVEIGKALGARVVAAVSSDEKASAAREAGADETLVYKHDPEGKDEIRALTEQFKDAVGRAGAQVVYDPVGGTYAEPAIRALGWGGRYLVIGFAAGIPRPPLNLLLLKSGDLRGVFWGTFAERFPDQNRANVAQLMTWWSEGRIRPRIGGVWPLAEGGQAIAHMAHRQAIGKLIVRA